MSGALNMPKLNPERCAPRAHGTWEQGSQKLLLFAPLNVCNNINASTPCKQPIPLHHMTGVTKRALHGDL